MDLHAKLNQGLLSIYSISMIIELSCVNEAGIAMTPSCINPRKRALSGSDIPPVDSSESLSEIANIDIKRARKRALSGLQVQTDSLTKNTKRKLTVLSKGDNVIIPIPSVDRGPADERNIKGVVMNVNEHGGYIDNAQNLALHSTISYSLSLSDSYHSLGLQTHLKWHLQKIEPDFRLNLFSYIVQVKAIFEQYFVHVITCTT
jgi:hypothetical protein